MTRDEFIHDVTSWGELLSLCWENDCDECDDICEEVDIDEHVNEVIENWACSDRDWRKLRNQLNDIPDYSPSGYYYCDSYDGSFESLNDDGDFSYYKRNVLDWGDRYCVWEEDDENVEDTVTEDFSDETELEIDEGCTLGTLFTSCSEKLGEFKAQVEDHNIAKDEEEIEEEENVLDFFYA